MTTPDNPSPKKNATTVWVTQVREKDETYEGWSLDLDSLHRSFLGKLRGKQEESIKLVLSTSPLTSFPHRESPSGAPPVVELYRELAESWALCFPARRAKRPASGFLFPGIREERTSDLLEFESLKDQNNDLLLECERLRTQLIASERRLVDSQHLVTEVRRHCDHVEERFDRLLSVVHQTTVANKSLQRALCEMTAGRLCMHEQNLGVVTREIDDDSVGVEFETSTGPLEQVYLRNQFINRKLPREGDLIEAHVFAWKLPHERGDVTQYLTPEEIEHGFPAFRKAISRKKSQ